MCIKSPLSTRSCNWCRVHEEEKSSHVLHTGSTRNRDRLLWLSLQKKLLRLTLILLLPLDSYSMTSLTYKLLFLYLLPHLTFKWPNHILICFLCSCYHLYTFLGKYLCLIHFIKLWVIAKLCIYRQCLVWNSADLELYKVICLYMLTAILVIIYTEIQ